MTITVQVIPDNHTQRDGTRYVLEIYSDAQGEVHRRTCRITPQMDANAIAAARLVRLTEALADQEVEEAIRKDKAPTLRFQTDPQFLQRVRNLYRESSGEVLVKIARWLRHRIQAGDVTEQQIQNVFGLSTAEWNALKQKLQDMANALDSVEAAQGE